MSAPAAGPPGRDTRTQFGPVADAYAAHRPAYPDALFAWLGERARLGAGAAVVDLGCGTGIASRAMAARGWRVVGIDPDPAMLARARAAGGGVEYRRGEAEATDLATASADLVTGAQCFHWFNLDRALPEVARVLRPGGLACAFWNVRGRSPFMDAYEALLLAASPEYAAKVARGDARGIDALRAHGAVRVIEERTFPASDALDADASVGRASSASYVAHGVPDLARFERDLRALVARHAADGRVEWTMETRALAFVPTAGPVVSSGGGGPAR